MFTNSLVKCALGMSMIYIRLLLHY